MALPSEFPRDLQVALKEWATVCSAHPAAATAAKPSAAATSKRTRHRPKTLKKEVRIVAFTFPSRRIFPLPNAATAALERPSLNQTARPVCPRLLSKCLTTQHNSF